MLALFVPKACKHCGGDLVFFIDACEWRCINCARHHTQDRTGQWMLSPAVEGNQEEVKDE